MWFYFSHGHISFTWCHNFTCTIDGKTHLHIFSRFQDLFVLWRYLTVRQSRALWRIWTLKWNVNLLFAQPGPKSSLLLSANKKINEIDDGWNKNSSQPCTRSISLTHSRQPSFSVSDLLLLFFCVRGSQSGHVPILSVLWQRQNTPATQSSTADNSTKNNLQSLSFYFFLSFSPFLSVCSSIPQRHRLVSRAHATQINL